MGLVEQVTNVVAGDMRSCKFLLNRLNQTRRVRRMQKVVVAAAEAARTAVNQPGRREWRVVMVTLTYASGVSWEAFQVERWCRLVRDWAKRRGVRARTQWVIELTKRGVPHYHALVWLPHDVFLPRSDKRGWWPHGMTRTEPARSCVGYLVKYASKGENSVYPLPKRCRLFGVGGRGEAERLITHRAGLPMWLAERTSDWERCSRAVGGGWFCRDTGEHFRSPFIVWWGRDDFGIAKVSIIKECEVTYSVES